MNSTTAQRATPEKAVRRQHGLTLIEVLVTLTIVSVGLLGVAGLQGMAKRSTHQAYQRTLATQLVDGVIERIRANPTAVASYHTGTGSPQGGDAEASKPSPDCSGVNVCTDTQLAAYDLWAWGQLIDGTAVTRVIDGTTINTGGLINPRGCILFAADAGKTNTGQISIMLGWQGLTEISDAVEAGGVVCGSGGANSNTLRRQAVVNTYIYDDTE
jgi:type IV pilus assembly protein PilV